MLSGKIISLRADFLTLLIKKFLNLANQTKKEDLFWNQKRTLTLTSKERKRCFS